MRLRLARHYAARGRLEVKLKGRDELLPVSAAHSHLFRELR
jgi:hypothetical protein